MVIEQPDGLFAGSINGHPVTARAFLYRNPNEPKSVRRWGVRIQFSDHWVEPDPLRTGGNQPRQFEIYPSPYESLSSAVLATEKAEAFLVNLLGFERSN